jgi:hypothetical protein
VWLSGSECNIIKQLKSAKVHYDENAKMDDRTAELRRSNRHAQVSALKTSTIAALKSSRSMFDAAMESPGPHRDHETKLQLTLNSILPIHTILGNETPMESFASTQPRQETIPALFHTVDRRAFLYALRRSQKDIQHSVDHFRRDRLVVRVFVNPIQPIAA